MNNEERILSLIEQGFHLNKEDLDYIADRFLDAEKYNVLFSRLNGTLYDTFLDQVIEESNKYKEERDKALEQIKKLEHLCKCHENAMSHNCNLFEKEQEKNKELITYVKALMDHILPIDINTKLDGSYIQMRFKTTPVDVNDGDDYKNIKALLEVIK